MVTVWENSAAAVLGGSFAVFSVGVGYQFTLVAELCCDSRSSRSSPSEWLLKVLHQR